MGSLIIMDSDRGLDYTDFADELIKSGIDNIICLPDTGYSIGKLMESKARQAA